MAAPVPVGSAEVLWHELAELRERHPGARWTESGKLHLTLVFLGATDPELVPELSRAVEDVAARWSAFQIATSTSGGYLGRRGGVAWLTIGGGRRELSRLSRELDAAMGSGVYARSGPRPHLTVARRVDQQLLDELEVATLSFRVESLELLRSHTGPAGSRYETLARFELG